MKSTMKFVGRLCVTVALAGVLSGTASAGPWQSDMENRGFITHFADQQPYYFPRWHQLDQERVAHAANRQLMYEELVELYNRQHSILSHPDTSHGVWLYTAQQSGALKAIDLAIEAREQKLLGLDNAYPDWDEGLPVYAYWYPTAEEVTTAISLLPVRPPWLPELPVFLLPFSRDGVLGATKTRFAAYPDQTVSLYGSLDSKAETMLHELGHVVHDYHLGEYATANSRWQQYLGMRQIAYNQEGAWNTKTNEQFAEDFRSLFQVGRNMASHGELTMAQRQAFRTMISEWMTSVTTLPHALKEIRLTDRQATYDVLSVRATTFMTIDESVEIEWYAQSTQYKPELSLCPESAETDACRELSYDGHDGHYRAKIPLSESHQTLLMGMGNTGYFNVHLYRIKLDAPNKAVTGPYVSERSVTEPVAVLGDLQGHWASADVLKAQEHGIINGYPDHTFRPDQAVSIEEFVTMLTRLLNVSPFTGKGIGNPVMRAASFEGIVPSPFLGGPADRSFVVEALNRALPWPQTNALPISDVPVPLQQQIANLHAAKIVVGYPNGTFQLDRKVTRAEAVVLLERVAAYIDDAKQVGNRGVHEMP